MRKEQADEWARNHDMPHEHLMDLYAIDYGDLNDSIQKDVRKYDDLYEDALLDGYIDQKEEKDLITASYKIAERIKEEHLNESTSRGGGLILGILTGIGVAVAAVFGINQIRE